MPGLTHSVDIAAPATRVWELLVDVDGWPRLIPTVEEAERLDDGPLALGSRTRLRQPRLPEGVWEVTAFEEGRSFTWASTSPGITVTAGHVVEARGEGSRLTLTIDVAGVIAPIGWLLTRRLTREYVETEARSIKAGAEG